MERNKVAKKQRGFFDYKNDGNVYVRRWNDSSVVTLASNHLTHLPVGKTKHYPKKLKKRMEVYMPHIVKNYNESMGGVDTMDKILSTLVSRFGNPKRVIEHHIQAIADLRPNRDRTLRELHDELVTHVRSLRALNRDTLGNQFASDIILTLCKRLLPKKILSLWEDKILESEEDPNEVETFFVFLHKQAEIEERVRQDNPKYGRQDRVEIKEKQHRRFNKVLSTSVAPGNRCSICRENHHVEECPLFLKATRPERWTLAKKYRLCFRCLRQGHRSTDCKRSHNSRNVTSVRLHRLLSEDENVQAAEENCTPHGDERSEKSPETTPTDVSEPTNAVRVCANITKDT
ncbi:PiggyBac transposable element-derived protein 3 [Trichinella britovi]|uniref:PiggyBac transposable element-derived protein 3 n=1 Tax=Trichinella britovi TaxID=45882 RepID=A0A0V1C7S8_TRIBR|nr:PiggyBac transposable element-derived protein 3 [Trichinella britovi]